MGDWNEDVVKAYHQIHEACHDWCHYWAGFGFFIAGLLSIAHGSWAPIAYGAGLVIGVWMGWGPNRNPKH